MVQGTEDRTEEGASLLGTLLGRQLRTCAVEAVIAPEVVASHRAEVNLECTHPMLSGWKLSSPQPNGSRRSCGRA
jgi:hypothetical protein